jgi:hypothetical protein
MERLLRGRALQSDMIAAKEKRLQLIQATVYFYIFIFLFIYLKSVSW